MTYKRDCRSLLDLDGIFGSEFRSRTLINPMPNGQASPVLTGVVASDQHSGSCYAIPSIWDG